MHREGKKSHSADGMCFASPSPYYTISAVITAAIFNHWAYGRAGWRKSSARFAIISSLCLSQHKAEQLLRSSADLTVLEYIFLTLLLREYLIGKGFDLLPQSHRQSRTRFVTASAKCGYSTERGNNRIREIRFCLIVFISFTVILGEKIHNCLMMIAPSVVSNFLTDFVPK